MAADRFPVESGHIMMFARSVNDDNQIYYSQEYAQSTEVGHIIAPPTFVQSSAQFDPNYFLRPKVGQPWFGSGKDPSGVAREGGGGGGVAAAVCTQSSTSSITVTSDRAMCSVQRHFRASPGSGRVPGPASSASPKPSPSIAISTANSSSRPAASVSAPNDPSNKRSRGRTHGAECKTLEGRRHLHRAGH